MPDDFKNYDGSGNQQNQSNVYFAVKEPKACASALMAKGDTFFNTLRANAYLEKISRMWKFYHGLFQDSTGYGHQIDFTGEQGELVTFPVNHFRNIADHIINMICGTRPVMEARAVNTDYKSLSQTYVASGILDYYMRERHLESSIKKAVEMAVILGTGYIKLEWNSTAGEKYDVDPETGVPVYEGEAEFTNLSPFDVIFDGTRESWNNDWILTRSFQNRYNLMAKYPEMADKILGMTPKSASTVYRLAVFSNDDTDDIPVYEFYHKRTEAMPNGRYMLFVDSEVVLLDTDMPYREIPIYRIVPSEIMGTPYGYTPMFDIYPIQECINSTYSAIMTNQNAFAVQNVWVPRGSDIQISNLEGAMNIIESLVKPEPLNLTQTPKEVFEFLNVLIQSAETISGVNSVARGNPESSLKSGSALALVQSMALQFMSGLQQSYVMMVEQIGTGIINILKDFATTPKVIAIVGKNNRTELKEFTGEDIDSINRVVVDLGNPLSKSIAGRVQMADQMLQMKLIQSPQQYFQVISTGRLDSMFEGEEAELLGIKKENEMMMNGEPAFALAIDQHKLHIVEHRSILADPELRKDNNIVKVVTDHILEHVNLLRITDPGLLQILDQQPLAPLQPPIPQGMPVGPDGQPIQQSAPPSVPQQPIPQAAQRMGRHTTIDRIGPAMENPEKQKLQSVNTVRNGQQMLPSPAKPPHPFENLPTSASEMAPK